MSDNDNFYCVSSDLGDAVATREDEPPKSAPRRVPLEPLDAGEIRFDPDTYVEGPNDEFHVWADEERG